VLLVKAVDDAVERRADGGKVQLGRRQVRFGVGLGQFGLEELHLVQGNHFLVVQPLRVIQLKLRELGLGQFGVELCLVESRYDAEHRIALFHPLTFLDRDRLEVSARQRTDFDVALRVDLTDVLLRENDVLDQWVGDHDFVRRFVLCFVVVGTAGKGCEEQCCEDGRTRRDIHLVWLPVGDPNPRSSSLSRVARRGAMRGGLEARRRVLDAVMIGTARRANHARIIKLPQGPGASPQDNQA
jgi:hypothetical protein